MKNLLEYIILGIVEKPESVKIDQTTQEGEEVLSLTVDPEDMGKVIGKNGQIIRSIRILLRSQAFKQGKKARILLNESQLEK
ncbi:MAG: KH domain-containing protein [bacterium]|nr:KH domain-containing protein [bacterium]